MEIESVDQLERRILEGTYQLYDSEGLKVSEVFEVLPERKIQDYYRIIKHPMSLTKVFRNITHKRYKRFHEFMNSMAQICYNAKLFNEEGSIIYNHADILENYLRDELTKLQQRGTLSDKELQWPKLGELPGDQDVVGGDDSNNEYDEEDEEDGRRRRGRPRRSVTLKRQQQQQQQQQEEEEDEENESMQMDDTRKKRGRPPTVDRPHEHRIKAIMRGVRKEKDGKRGALHRAFEKLPDQKMYPDYYEQISNPISLDSIRKLIKRREYKSVEAFMNDMNMMFNNAKMYNQDGSEIFNDADYLQRVMLSLAEEEMKKPDSVYQDPESNSKTARLPLDQIEHRGEIYRVGDWVHINNNNDPSKPTIGQIFRIWKTITDRVFINACWYYRPEQTVHQYDKLFYENEVVKSGQYQNHQVDEILEKCFVMFVTKYQRGRPAGIGDRSVYCCESRYNRDEKTFNKIRTWKACIPDEVRSTDYPMDMFERTHMLRRVISPIKHLLPPDAKEDDPIPDPRMGDPNAPPVIGAVYKRPYDPTDPPEQPTDETADVGTPKQAASKRSFGSQPGNSNTRQYIRQPQPFLPPGGSASQLLKRNGPSTGNTPAQSPLAGGGGSGGGTSHQGTPHSPAVPTTPSAGGFYQPSQVQHGLRNNSIGYMPPAPNAVFTLPKHTQDLLPECDLQDKVVRTFSKGMAWFSCPPVYISQRIVTTTERDSFAVSIAKENEDDGEEDKKVVNKKRPAPLGQSAAYMLWKRRRITQD